MAQNHRKRGDFPDCLENPLLMSDVDRAEIAGDGEGIQIVLVLSDPRQGGFEIERFLFFPLNRMAPSKVFEIRGRES